MGFWGSLGKSLLKVGKIAAPIALAATGFGIPAAAALTAGLSAADTKASGGSWKSALTSGAIGGGLGMIPGLGGFGGAAKNGIPTLASQSFGTITGEVGKKGFGSILGNTLKSAGSALLNPDALQGIGQVAGAQAAGAAKGREAEDVFNFNKYDRDAAAHKTQLEYDATMPALFSKQAVAADLLGNFKGTSGSVFAAKTKEELDAARAQKNFEMNDESKRAVAEWQRQSIERLFNPRVAPTTPEQVKAGKMENALGTAGMVSQFASALRGYRPPQVGR